MSKEAMKLALEALYSMKETLAEHDEPTTFNEDEAIKALEEALEAKDEPVAKIVPCYTPSGKRVALNTEYQHLPIGTNLYTTPQPQRPWVGLTDEERKEIAEQCIQPLIFLTTPQLQREWVGLTDEDIANIVVEMNGNEPTALFWRDLARAIEAAHGITGEQK